MKVFAVLGNNWPQVLIQLEDCVLHGILTISAGKSSEEVIGTIYSQLQSLEKELTSNSVALNWFDIHMTGGLASPPETCYNSPEIGIALLSAIFPQETHYTSPTIASGIASSYTICLPDYVNLADLQISTAQFTDTLVPIWNWDVMGA